MAGVTKMRRSKAEEDCDTAAELALVLQKVDSMFWAHLEVIKINNFAKVQFTVSFYLCFRDVTAASTDKLFRVEIFTKLNITSGFASIVSLQEHFCHNHSSS